MLEQIDHSLAVALGERDRNTGEHCQRVIGLSLAPLQTVVHAARTRSADSVQALPAAGLPGAASSFAATGAPVSAARNTRRLGSAPLLLAAVIAYTRPPLKKNENTSGEPSAKFSPACSTSLGSAQGASSVSFGSQASGPLAGAPCVGVSFGAHDHESFEPFAPLFVAHSTRDLHDWLLAHA